MNVPVAMFGEVISKWMLSTVPLVNTSPFLTSLFMIVPSDIVSSWNTFFPLPNTTYSAVTYPSSMNNALSATKDEVADVNAPFATLATINDLPP